MLHFIIVVGKQMVGTLCFTDIIFYDLKECSQGLFTMQIAMPENENNSNSKLWKSLMRTGISTCWTELNAKYPLPILSGFTGILFSKFHMVKIQKLERIKSLLHSPK